MSLREEIERHRMAQSANGNVAAVKSEKPETHQSSAAAASPSAAFLRLEKLDKRCWVLPWSSFHGVGFVPADATGADASKYDRLHLVFARHEVGVRGCNLASVVTAIEATALCELCETAEKYTDARKPDAATPAILAVEITVKAQ